MLLKGGGYDDQNNETRKGWERRLQLLFRTVMMQRHYYSQIRLIGLAERGRELVRTERQGGAVSAISAGGLQEKGQYPYVLQAATLLEGEVYYSDVTLNREQGRIVQPWEPMLRLSTPVFDPHSGKPYGVVVVNINFNHFTRPLNQKVLEDSFYLLANASGEYLIHPEKEKLFSFEMNGREENLSKDYPELNLQEMRLQWQQKGAVGEEGVTRMMGARDVGVSLLPFHFDSRQPERYLLLGTEVSSQVLREKSEGFRDRLVMLILLVSGVLTLAMTIAVRRLTQPIRDLTLMAERVSQGDESVDIDISGGDEVGDLASAFSIMLNHLQQSRHFSDQIIATAPVGMAVLCDKKIVVANFRFTDLLGSQEEGEEIESYLRASGLDAKLLLRILLAIRLSEMVEGVETKLRGRDLSFTLSPIEQIEKKHSGMVFEEEEEEFWLLLVDDVTEARLAAKKLHQASSEVAYQSGMSEMSTTVLHNIGNAINSIGEQTYQLDKGRKELVEIADLLQQQIALVETELEGSACSALPALQQVMVIFRRTPEMLHELDEEGLRENIGNIRTGVGHITEIVRVQQTLVKEGSNASFSQSFDLLTAIHDARSMLSVSLEKRGIVLMIAVTVDEVSLPRNPFLQMVGNLLKNAMEAIDANPEVKGQGVIDLRAEIERSDSDYFEMRISDNGCGIESERLSTIFHFGETDKMEGSGFGLHSVANFVQSNGGTIRAESDGPAEGATFVVRLPVSSGDKNHD
ncbi:MAG: HAMP domain-containing protein, partial [Gammaproteobacteria bacterium]|nr:HAMP domain-containing protein [Gammaproteobacteria bacterium]